MFVQLLCVFGLTCVTVILHAVGTLASIGRLSRAWQRKEGKQGPLISLIFILRLVSVLLVLHWIEAGVWAVFYTAVEALPDLETASYFSLTSYSTIGYGDVVLPPEWRLLGPFEGAVGILMFGWSTGIMVAAITRIYGGRFQDSRT